MMVTVHSNYQLDNKKADPSKPGYWVTDEKGNVLFESELGDEAVQWAIDYQSSMQGEK